jgi:hypothetical protein
MRITLIFNMRLNLSTSRLHKPNPYELALSMLHCIQPQKYNKHFID